jgi:hypothetical protein
MSEWVSLEAGLSVFCIETDGASLVDVSQSAEDAGLQWLAVQIEGPYHKDSDEVILMCADWELLMDISHDLVSCASLSLPRWVDPASVVEP